MYHLGGVCENVRTRLEDLSCVNFGFCWALCIFMIPKVLSAQVI